MKRPYYMDSTRAKEFGVIDKVSLYWHTYNPQAYVSCKWCLILTDKVWWSQILWRGQEKIMADVAPPEDWDKGAGIKVVEGL